MRHPGNSLRVTASLAAMLWVAALAAGQSARPATSSAPCGVGSYRMSDGSSLDIAPDDAPRLRWSTIDGRTGALTPDGARWTSTLGWTERADGHHVSLIDCGRGGLRFDELAGSREPLLEIDTRFEGSGVTLAGRLTLPPGKAMEVADAVAAVVASNFTGGYEQLAAVKRRYGSEKWFGAVRGNVAAHVLSATPEALRREGPVLLEGVPAQYDPLPVLTHLDVPQLWIHGGQDRDAPPGETLRRLAKLQATGRPISTAVFHDADHGLYEFETRADGERVSTRQPDGYFQMIRDFILGSGMAARYGEAEWSADR